MRCGLANCGGTFVEHVGECHLNLDDHVITWVVSTILFSILVMSFSFGGVSFNRLLSNCNFIVLQRKKVSFQTFLLFSNNYDVTNKKQSEHTPLYEWNTKELKIILWRLLHDRLPRENNSWLKPIKYWKKMDEGMRKLNITQKNYCINGENGKILKIRVQVSACKNMLLKVQFIFTIFTLTHPLRLTVFTFKNTNFKIYWKFCTSCNKAE